MRQAVPENRLALAAALRPFFAAMRLKRFQHVRYDTHSLSTGKSAPQASSRQHSKQRQQRREMVRKGQGG